MVCYNTSFDYTCWIAWNYNDSLKCFNNIQHKSINFNPAILLGNELGLSGRIEYENSKWGKIIFNSVAWVNDNFYGGLIFDVGLGYGYPIINSKNFAIFINGLST